MLRTKNLITLNFTLALLASVHLYASTAQVRSGTSLCNQETTFLNARLATIKANLASILGTQLTDAQVPRIALCASGGGYRAMVATLGWLEGESLTTQKNSPRGFLSTVASWFGVSSSTPSVPNNGSIESESLNLRDVCTHFAALSGSTWALSGLEYSRMTPTDYVTHITPQISTSIFQNINMQDLAAQILKKENAGQPVSFIDIYGIILAQKLLSNLGDATPSSIDLAAYVNMATSMNKPLPIQTSLIANDATNYHWVEYSPYEIGSTDLQAFIPTTAFGKKFNNGTSQDATSPESLGFCMGTWGSAMSVDPNDFLRLVIDPYEQSITPQYLQQTYGSVVASAASLFERLQNDVVQDLAGDSIMQSRISPASIFNFVAGLPNTQFNTQATLTLVDGGIDCNLPVFPLLRPERAIDIIIILDASAGTFGQELHNAQTHAQKWGYPFPAIDYTKINQPCSVHWDQNNAAAPIVIYMPLIQNSGYQNNWDPWSADFTNTENFTYTPAQTAQLSGLTSYNMSQNMPLIINTIKQWVALKQQA